MTPTSLPADKVLPPFVRLCVSGNHPIPSRAHLGVLGPIGSRRRSTPRGRSRREPGAGAGARASDRPTGQQHRWAGARAVEWQIKQHFAVPLRSNTYTQRVGDGHGAPHNLHLIAVVLGNPRMILQAAHLKSSRGVFGHTCTVLVISSSLLTNVECLLDDYVLRLSIILWNHSRPGSDTYEKSGM